MLTCKVIERAVIQTVFVFRTHKHAKIQITMSEIVSHISWCIFITYAKKNSEGEKERKKNIQNRIIFTVDFITFDLLKRISYACTHVKYPIYDSHVVFVNMLLWLLETPQNNETKHSKNGKKKLREMDINAVDCY